MRIDLAREHTPVTDLTRRPDLRDAHEAHAKQEQLLRRWAGTDITDSEPVRSRTPEPGDPLNPRRLEIGYWNPWADRTKREPAA